MPLQNLIEKITGRECDRQIAYAQQFGVTVLASDNGLYEIYEPRRKQPTAGGYTYPDAARVAMALAQVYHAGR